MNAYHHREEPTGDDVEYRSWWRLTHEPPLKNLTADYPRDPAKLHTLHGPKGEVVSETWAVPPAAGFTGHTGKIETRRP